MVHHFLHLKLSRIIMISAMVFLTILADGQTRSDSDLPQFLYPEFTDAILKLKNGKSQNLEMNYNIVTGNMVFKRDGKLYDLLNTEMVDTVYLRNSKFIRFGKVFYEVILASPVSLFLDNKGSLVSVGKPAGYGSTSQTSSITSVSGISTNSGYYNIKLPPDMTVRAEQIYWLRKNNEMFSFINMKQFLKIFPGKENEIKEYVKNNRIKIDRKEDLVKLMDYCKDFITGK